MNAVAASSGVSRVAKALLAVVSVEQREASPIWLRESSCQNFPRTSKNRTLCLRKSQGRFSSFQNPNLLNPIRSISSLMNLRNRERKGREIVKHGRSDMRWPSSPKQSKAAFHRAAAPLVQHIAITSEAASYLYTCLRLTEDLTIRNVVGRCTSGTVTLEEMKACLRTTWRAAQESVQGPP